MDEFGLIRSLTHGRQTGELHAANGVVVGIGDDAAVTAPTPGLHTVMSCDTMVQDVHFKSITMTDADVGFKAMAASVSDIAAMGAMPRHALVSISVPKRVSQASVAKLYAGLYACANALGVAVIGGDTTSSPDSLVVSVTALGEVEPGRALLRSAARSGDVVFVTGWPGCSAAGLDFLLGRSRQSEENETFEEPLETLVRAHRRPLPRIEAGRMLSLSGVCHALNDVSDGVASEAWEIAEASQCGIVLDEAALPVHPSLRAYASDKERDALEFLLFGGEDYELIGTMPAEHAEQVGAAIAATGLPFTVIGEVTDAFAGVRLSQAGGRTVPIDKKGYNHFA
ncbi:thiamine-phosphate kinase [Paenibacillus sp. MBLB4367]|uniref:thiamine-phosphate kinase n=1 Tax=Paenibacillus sp. MBLB4367 TaxID=3384767 RepID=UPI0039082CDA